MTAPDLELDCRGMRCPLPVIELARRINDVPIGALLAVLATDPAAGVDIPAWCRMRGHEFVGAGRDETQGAAEESTDPVARYLVRRLA